MISVLPPPCQRKNKAGTGTAWRECDVLRWRGCALDRLAWGSASPGSIRLAPPPAGRGPERHVTITLNGEPHDLPGPLSLTALLAHLDLDPRRVAIEHNLAIVKRAGYDTAIVREGDRVEIVNFVGGG